MLYKEQIDKNRIPAHVAIIRDGNGRWAKQKNQPRSFGHQAGAETVHVIAEEAARLGVKYLTLYTFSTENWNRPADEVNALMALLMESIEEEIFMKNRFKEGQDWYTIEGACYFYENGHHYLLYSANCYGNEYYFVGYAAASSDELDLTKVEFSKQPNDYEYKPLLNQNEYESGTGHNTVIKYKGDYYIVYHGRDIGHHTVEDNRTMRIAKMEIDGLKLKVLR